MSHKRIITGGCFTTTQRQRDVVVELIYVFCFGNFFWWVVGSAIFKKLLIIAFIVICIGFGGFEKIAKQVIDVDDDVVVSVYQIGGRFHTGRIQPETISL